MKKLMSLLVLFFLVLSVTASPAHVSAQEEEPTVEPTEEPTDEPTEEPTAEPTEEPTAEPTEEPTAEPTEEPTAEPTEEPTAEPTEEPTAEPTEEPTAEPTEEPTAEPTEEPTAVPTEEPTAETVEEPTPVPTEEPTAVPTEEPVVVEDTGGVSGSGAQAGPWSATIYLSNPNDTAATGAISFYETDGSLDATYDFTNIGASGIPAHGSAAIDVASVGIGASSWQGSAVVQASNQVAAQVALQVNSNTDRMVYSGFTQGSDKVSSPAIACNAFDQDSDLVVMNTGSTDTTFTVSYLSTTGGNEPTTGPHTVKANSSTYLDVCNEVGETSGWLGSATVNAANSSDALVAVVFQPYVVAPKAVAYETLAGTGGNTVFFPTALQKAFGAQFTSFYAVQNVGAGSTTVTLEVFNTSGVSQGTVSQALTPGQKVSWQPQDAGAATTGFSGSAVVSASGAGEIAAITNIGTLPAGGGCPTGSGQTTAFLNPSDRAGDSGSKLAIPWVEYKSGIDWRSFLAVQNVNNTGSASGTITVTYYNPNGTTAATDSLGSISDGAKGNSNPNTAGAGSDFLGSIEIDSANSADALVGLTNNQQADGCHAASALAIPIN